MHIEKRTEKFKRNTDLELFLKEINSDLKIVEDHLIKSDIQEYPIIFIVGPLRSGTTLMLQWLAATSEFSYPSNLLSRFYGAPIMGAKIQQLLTNEKYNFRNEILDFNTTQNYQSENGKTKGALSPNEFWYFWRRYFPFEEKDYFTDEELLNQGDSSTFRQELLGVADVMQKPFALKALICNYNIKFLNQLFDKALFIYTKRNPIQNIESVLKARERQSDDVNEWYSFKIPEYNELIKIKNPIKQVAGQIYHINNAVQNGLKQVPEEKKLIVDYEKFCDNPEYYYYEIVNKLKIQGCNIAKEYKGEKSFRATRQTLNPEIEKLYNEYVMSKKAVE